MNSIIALPKKPPKLARRNAESILSNLVVRAAEVNTGDYVWIAQELWVFGSFLTDKDPIGDLDVFVLLHRRCTEKGPQSDAEKRSMERAPAYYIRSTIGQIIWPREEVMRALKGRVKAISLHDCSLMSPDHELFEATAKRLVYQREA